MADDKVYEALPQPCKECPWRIENQGQRHQHGFYTKANLRRLWAGLRRGARMTCHPTDPRMVEYEGYEGTADAARTHECLGSIILIQREFMRAQKLIEADAKHGSTTYRKRFARGLTREGLLTVAQRFFFGGSPLDPLAMARPNLNMPGIGHPDLPPWQHNETKNRPDDRSTEESDLCPRSKDQAARCGRS